jgi:predicted O-methyltransferase YrrM
VGRGGLLGSVIPGWLRRPDALKLYEMAYFADGDVLEVGSYRGLSAGILSRANRNSPRPKTVSSVDTSLRSVLLTRWNLLRMGLHRGVQVRRASALSAIEAFAAAGRRFAFVFVDHSHTYEAIHAFCSRLSEVLSKGGFCLFHDFNDPANRGGAYGVYRAVLDALPQDDYTFHGIYGCSALYRRSLKP